MRVLVTRAAEDAETIYARHDVATAAKLIRPLAEKGDAVAQNRLQVLDLRAVLLTGRNYRR